MIVFYVISGIVGGVLIGWLFIWCNNGWLQRTRYTVELPVERRVKIVHLSDLHGKRFGAKNVGLASKVAKENPDFIVITGDLVHRYRKRDITVSLELVSTLAAIAPVLYVSGNHEMRNKGYRFFRKDLKEAGAVVLDDENCEICGLTVTGLNCASLKNDRIFTLNPSGEGKILLAHQPQYLEKYATAGYSLVLCGHAHGGQWRIPFTGVGFYAPGQGIFPKLTSGEHVCGGTHMIVSRGLGNSECPLRLFNRPEIVVVSVVPVKIRGSNEDDLKIV